MKRMPALTKNESWPTTSGIETPGRCLHAIEDGEGVGEREGDLLHRRRTGFLQVVAADVHRVPLRDVRDGVLDGVGGEAQRRLGREDVRAARQELLEDVVLRRAAQLARDRRPGASAAATYSASSHAAVALMVIEVFIFASGIWSKSASMSAMWQIGTPTLPTSPGGHRVVGVVAGLRRQIEGDAQAGLPFGEVGAEQLVGRVRVGVTRVGPHQPGLFALRHGGNIAGHFAALQPRGLHNGRRRDS